MHTNSLKRLDDNMSMIGKKNEQPFKKWQKSLNFNGKIKTFESNVATNCELLKKQTCKNLFSKWMYI